MGFNTAVLILNDRLHEIASDERFGERLSKAILTARREGGQIAGASALPSEHADVAQVVVIAGNSIRSIGYGHWADDDHKIVKRLAENLGYRLCKKKSNRAPKPTNIE